MVKVRTFWNDNMTNTPASLDKLETKWTHVLQTSTLPFSTYSTLDQIKKDMKQDTGYIMGVDAQLKTMDSMGDQSQRPVVA